MIEPRTLKGFRDYLPEDQILRERLLDKVRHVYRSYGFVPIDTPALEYTEILLGKGGEESDRLIYRFRDHGGRDVALRFDLTVPFARFAAQHINQLGTPFKRYHMGPVWRGENTAHGRFREFWQCDFDIIGTTSNAADLETVLVIHDLMTTLGFERFSIRINNRLVLNGLLEEIDLAEQTTNVLRALDKLGKIGREGVIAEMAEKGVPAEQAQRVLDMATIEGSNDDILMRLAKEFGSSDKAMEGIRRLRELLAAASAAGIHQDRLQIDVSIARGLDYYTGTIYETFLDDLPQIGSVCSGGRYDNLASLFTKQVLPGVGASLGLDRLLAAMDGLHLNAKTGATAPVLIIQFIEEKLGEYQRLGRTLRAAGIGAEVFPEAKKIGQQLKYADRRGFRLAVLAGPDELAANQVKVKNLATGQEEVVAADELVAVVKKALGENGSDGG
ncbi:MAG: histidine--tRNA ligase [Gemmatales bacterium]|nr:MAG: histidine--tRNA ligase [Gemmatales bacterium]